MRVRIHRGAREVGGSCVEIQHGGRRIVLDVGRPLDGGLDADLPLPAMPGLASGDPALLGVVVSHPHPDHYGLVAGADGSVPIYMGEAAQRVLAEAAFFTPGGGRFDVAGFLRDREPFELGPFRITPYLMDHSAFDAYALLVEAGGQRLLYSGDVRAHGRKAGLFERFVAAPPGEVDTLLLEGTHVRDSPTLATPGLSERGVEDRYVEMMRETKGIVLACYSPQNIDRVVSLFRACKRTGRTLVLDLYAASITRATGHLDTIPQADWAGVRVFVPVAQRVRVKRAKAFERIDWVTPHRLYPEKLAEQADELVMTFRHSMATDLDSADCLTDAQAVWSLWPGYLDSLSGTRLRNWLDQRAIPLTLVHSSGHASVEDLQRFATAVSARQVVPIHTSAPERFAGLFSSVALRDDGEWWEVCVDRPSSQPR
jgi:ribonuclease J